MRIHKKFKYDIALSFAGEQKAYAKELATKLCNCGLKVFYDGWNNHKFWGKDLTKLLHKVYLRDSRYVIILFSKEYTAKFWTDFEFNLLNNKKSNYLLPISIDGTFPDEWSPTRCYINAKDYSIDEIALMARDIVFNIDYEEDNDMQYEKKTMIITNDDGSTEECEIIVAFEFTDTEREFVVYTKNELDDSGTNVMLYVSMVIEVKDGEAVLGEVLDEDWPRVKDVLKELSADEDNSLPKTRGIFKDKNGDEILV